MAISRLMVCRFHCFLYFAGHSGKVPAANYSVGGSPVSKMFGVFNSLVIIATTYGNGIIPEIQVCLKFQNYHLS